MRELLRLVGLVRPHWQWILLGVGLSLLTLLANIGLLALSSWFIASMAIAGAAHATIDFTLPSAGVRALALGRTGGRYLERLVNHNTTFRILARLRVWFFERLEPLAPAGLSRYRSGDLLSRIRSDIDALDDFYVRAFVPVIVAFFGVAAVSLFIAGYSPQLMLIDLAALTAGGVALPLMLLWLGRRAGGEHVALASDLRAAVVDEVQGAAELIALGALEAHREMAEQLSEELTRREGRLSSLEGAADGGIVLTSGLAMWAGALLLVPLVAGGKLAPADIAMLTVLMLASFEAIMPLPAVFKRLGEMAAAARRLFEIIDAEPSVVEQARQGGVGPGATVVAVPPETAARDDIDGEGRLSGWGLRVESLHFSYSGAEPWVIRDLSFELPEGGCLALAGPTGAGKSSLVNVLLRFWDYTRGSILVAGRELKAMSGDRARELFSVAEQNPFLFHASIRDNLAIARPGAADSELVEVLERAQLGGLLETMRDGLDTLVGESGLRLSVGQARRLSVARALLKRAPFLVLDEPTEGLDDVTADSLLDAVERTSRGRTIIVISHRRRDLRIADHVVRMAISR